MLPSTIRASDHQLVVVLVEPEIPQNTGNIARLCVCSGAELYLVGTLGFQLGEKYLKRAGMDYLDHLCIRHVPDFETLLTEKAGWTPFYMSTKAKRTYTDVRYPAKSMLVFGSESRGLPESWLVAHPEETFRIPMQADARSLNVSSAASIVLYEAIRQQYA